MKKRFVITAVVLVLLLGLLGLQAFASDQSTSPAAIASWAATEPTVDGNANESDWLIYNSISGAEGTPVGTFGKLWHGENLYLAVNTGGASAMTLTLNTSYTLTVDLSGSGAPLSRPLLTQGPPSPAEGGGKLRVCRSQCVKLVAAQRRKPSRFG